MDREEAKNLLELCRPGNVDDRQDPTLAEAFALLDKDPELKAWFDEQQAVDQRISESMAKIEIPSDLKANILAGMRLHAANSSEKETEASSVTPFPTEDAHSEPTHSRSWWARPWIAIAAAFAIMMVILNAPNDESTANQIATAGLPPVLQYLSKEIDSMKAWSFDKRDKDPSNLQAFLANNQVPSPESIPSFLDGVPSIGCVTFNYGQGTELSMICFKNGEVYHLITADKATYPDSLPTEPQTFECKNKAFKLWIDGEQVKILTVHGTKEDIPEFI